jgi:hypothetical protein
MKRLVYSLVATVTIATAAAAQYDDGTSYTVVTCNVDGTYTCSRGCPNGYCC